MPRTGPGIIVALIACALCACCSIAIYAIYFRSHPLQDWMVYYGAARASLDGNLPLLLDAERFTSYLNARFAAWLPEPFSFRSWVYPPPFLLLLAPFGLLPFAFSWAVFEATGFAALLAAIWHYVGPGGKRGLHALSLLLAPAALFNTGTGQNGFLTGALLVGGFGLIERHPALAGMALGALTYKPQFCLLVPVALVALRERRATLNAVLTAAALALASLALFGIEPWRAWLEWVLNPPAAAYRQFLECCRLHDESVYTNLTLLAMPKAAADLGQLLAALFGAGCVWWSFRRPLPRELRLVVLLAATALAAPHVANYDAVLLAVAATLLFAWGIGHGFGVGGIVVPLLAWTVQLLNPPDVFRLGRVTPVVTVLLMLCAMARARTGEP